MVEGRGGVEEEAVIAGPAFQERGCESESRHVRSRSNMEDNKRTLTGAMKMGIAQRK